MSEEHKARIQAELVKRIKHPECPRCSNSNWTLADGYFRHQLHSEITPGWILGGPSIPTATLVCLRCGFLSEHALGVLGVLDKAASRPIPAENADDE